LLDSVSAAFAEAERQAEIARKAEAYAREQEAPFKVPPRSLRQRTNA
jgi:hypothetical protein